MAAARRAPRPPGSVRRMRQAYANPPRSVTAAEMEMEKMFRGRVRVFGPVEPTQGSLISAVARIALKSLVELLREQRIAAAEAVPELQLDMAAVACEIAPLVGAGNATTLASFLDDAATALATRGGAQGVLPPKEVTERLAMWRRARESSGIS